MTRLLRVLRYEIRLSVGFLLVVIAVVLGIKAVWPFAPLWLFIPAGMVIGGTERWWLPKPRGGAS